MPTSVFSRTARRRSAVWTRRGAGPLAGPVCAAAVLLPEGLVTRGLTTQKSSRRKNATQLYDIICESAVAFGIAFATVDEIEALKH